MVYLLDMKSGDVNGDGIPDNVYLYGHKPDGPSGIFADQITLIIQDGQTKRNTTVHLQSDAGYNAGLFLGDFDKDNVQDIFIRIDSGGSGGYGIFYIYSFKNNILRERFDYLKYNNKYKFNVHYEDFYKVSVGSPTLDVLFTIDISGKGYDYLSRYYDERGKLIRPVQGEVLALGALYPVVTNPKTAGYDLLALQRIIGTSNADTLGYVQNLLTWNGTEFSSLALWAPVLGTKLIALY